jgi:hypothetical protein
MLLGEAVAVLVDKASGKLIVDHRVEHGLIASGNCLVENDPDNEREAENGRHWTILAQSGPPQLIRSPSCPCGESLSLDVEPDEHERLLTATESLTCPR